MFGLYDIFLDLWQVILYGTDFASLFAELTLILVVLSSFWLFIQTLTLFRYKTNKTMHIITISIIILWIIKFLYPDGFNLISIVTGG